MFSPYRDLTHTYVAVDYDGTLVRDDGSYDLDAIRCLKELSKYNIKFIFWSCRPNSFLYKVAEDLYKKYGIVFECINDNCKEIKDAYDVEGRKIFSHFYVDDSTVGWNHVCWNDIYNYIVDYHLDRVARYNILK